MKQKSFFIKLRQIFKYTLTKVKIYYWIKYFYLIFFKADYFHENVMVIDKSLTKIIKKDLKNFLKVVEFNYEYKF